MDEVTAKLPKPVAQIPDGEDGLVDALKTLCSIEDYKLKRNNVTRCICPCDEVAIDGCGCSKIVCPRCKEEDHKPLSCTQNKRFKERFIVGYEKIEWINEHLNFPSSWIDVENKLHIFTSACEQLINVESMMPKTVDGSLFDFCRFIYFHNKYTEHKETLNHCYNMIRKVQNPLLLLIIRGMINSLRILVNLCAFAYFLANGINYETLLNNIQYEERNLLIIMKDVVENIVDIKHMKDETFRRDRVRIARIHTANICKHIDLGLKDNEWTFRLISM